MIYKPKLILTFLQILVHFRVVFTDPFFPQASAYWRDMVSHKGIEVADVVDESPEISASVQDDKETYPAATGLELPSGTASRITHVSGILTVLVAGIALFSDGYNAQVIGYMEPLFSDL